MAIGNNPSSANQAAAYTFTITWAAADLASISGPPALVTLNTNAIPAATVTTQFATLSGSTVQIVKQSSDTFRVNDPRAGVESQHHPNYPQHLRSNPTPRWPWTPTAIS